MKHLKKYLHFFLSNQYKRFVFVLIKQNMIREVHKFRYGKCKHKTNYINDKYFEFHTKMSYSQ